MCRTWGDTYLLCASHHTRTYIHTLTHIVTPFCSIVCSFSNYLACARQPAKKTTTTRATPPLLGSSCGTRSPKAPFPIGRRRVVRQRERRTPKETTQPSATRAAVLGRAQGKRAPTRRRRRRGGEGKEARIGPVTPSVAMATTPAGAPGEKSPLLVPPDRIRRWPGAAGGEAEL